MYKIILILLLGFVLPSTLVAEQKDVFVDGKYKTLLKKAKKEDKFLCFFVSTPYCGEVCEYSLSSFSDERVLKLYQDNFVCSKIYPDKVSNNIRLNSWGLVAMPSVVYLNSKGKVLHKFSGRISPEMLIQFNDSLVKISR